MILGSVGSGGKNFREDVITVQRLLKSKGCDSGAVDGICGNRTIDAIRRFQSKFMAHPDGVVEPGRQSWLQLSSTQGTTMPPALAQWSGDSALWSQDKKLLSKSPLLRPHVKAVLAALTGSAFQPTIFYGWRSVAV
ncbi:MAG: peptidoglycan-binding protein, partial [Alphaproteobacteria bacterium]